jgi:hypothetical protein
MQVFLTINFSPYPVASESHCSQLPSGRKQSITLRLLVQGHPKGHPDLLFLHCQKL